MLLSFTAVDLNAAAVLRLTFAVRNCERPYQKGFPMTSRQPESTPASR